MEGAEPAVLDGALATLRRHRPALLLEVEDRHLAKYGGRAEDVAEKLGVHGYRPYRWTGGCWTETTEIREDHRNYLFTA
ncbi:hypothetical protein ABZ729_15735 [Streptomyces sp. NPDC006678]|uniref:hypothetical protein n=1 Tax=Streptomyces sp. NPDC006678 TaxID=3157185 RepID=UPI0033DDE550